MPRIDDTAPAQQQLQMQAIEPPGVTGPTIITSTPGSPSARPQNEQANGSGVGSSGFVAVIVTSPAPHSPP
jgi:hypothetical protein